MMQMKLADYRIRANFDDSQISGYQELTISKIKAVIANDSLNDLSNLYQKSP